MPDFNQMQFPGMPERPRGPRTAAQTPRPDGKWSGPIPGQQVLPTTRSQSSVAPDRFHEVSGEVDQHGLVTELQYGRAVNHPDHDNPFSQKARALYSTHGGRFARTVHENVQAYADHVGMGYTEAENEYGTKQLQDIHEKNQMVTSHWQGQPLHEISAHTPVHTTQSITETLDPYQSGPERVGKIRQSLEAGDPMREPAWVVKQNDRLFALDGHHRILAARQAGLKSFPARVWDRDAQMAKHQARRAGGTQP